MSANVPYAVLPEPVLPRHRLPHGWQPVALFGLVPLWWLLGAGELIWPALSLPLLLAVVSRRVEVPRGFGIWILFLAWMLLSATQLDTGERHLAFLYRALVYASATVLFLYVYNGVGRWLPIGSVLAALTILWAFVVVGGMLGVLFPRVEFTSVVEQLLPPSLLQVDFVRTMVHPGFAQVHDFLGFDVGRPKALFAYTNGWGSALGLLTPFALCSFATLRRGAVRTGVGALLVLSVVPAVVSLNRGLWLSLGIGLLVAVVRLARRRNVRALGLAVIAVCCVLVVFLTTPLGSLAGDRLETGHSNRGREILYRESIQLTAASPLLGHGAPRPSEVSRYLPSVGTQGHLFLLLVSHGIPGAVLFCGWFARGWLRTRRAVSSIGFWSNIALLVFLVQIPFYDLLPMPLLIAVVALALALRAAEQPSRSGRASVAA